MSEKAGSELMRGGTALVLVGLALVTTMLLALLFAFAPELRKQESTSNDAVSVSAVGFAGLREFLVLSGVPAEVDRGQGGAARSLTILTPDFSTSAGDIKSYKVRGPVLIILPKWRVLPLQDHRGWVMRFPEISKAGAAIALSRLSELASARGGALKIQGLSGGRRWVDLFSDTSMLRMPPVSLTAAENLQVVTGGESLLSGPDGTILVKANDKGVPVYVLSDPDLMNNHALSREAVANAALGIIQTLRRGNGPVMFDVTLNGLGRTPDLWRALFEPPFLGASIAAFIAALLIAWHAMSRFGAPERTGRVFALGKKALADNTSGLIRMLGRERGMAERYVAAAREDVLAALGLKRASDAEQARLLARLESEAGLAPYADLALAARETRTGGDLLRTARKAYAWKQGIVRGN